MAHTVRAHTCRVEVTLMLLYVYKYVDLKRLSCHAGYQRSAEITPEMHLRNPRYAGKEAIK